MDAADDVDVYLPYVDGNDDIYAWQMLECAKLLGERGQQTARLNRINDFGQLRMAVRSIFFCVPWIRRLHLVFHHERQIPAWLNRSHPKIAIHLHREYFDSRILLPTFSSFVIDTQIGRVPGLAHRFVYLEDDQFFCRPIDRSRLFDREARPIQSCVRKPLGMTGWMDPRRYAKAPRRIWPQACKFSNLIWKRSLDSRDAAEIAFRDGHRPFPFLKGIFEQTHRRFPQIYERSIQQRFRRSNVLSLHSYLAGMVWTGQALGNGRWSLHRSNLPNRVPRAGVYEGYDSGCINDETSFDDDDDRALRVGEIQESVEALTAEMFPGPCDFEVTSTAA